MEYVDLAINSNYAAAVRPSARKKCFLSAALFDFIQLNFFGKINETVILGGSFPVHFFSLTLMITYFILFYFFIVIYSPTARLR